MNTRKPSKHGTVSLTQQEPDRSRHRPFTPSSQNKNSDVRATGRERDDAKLRSARGFVSDGPLPSSQTPAPTYPTGAQSLATASKASHNVSTHVPQGHPTYMSQKPPLLNGSLPQETHPTAERYFESTYDPRATAHRAVTTIDKASFMSPDPVRHVEDHHKSSRHRPRQPPTPVPENAELQTSSAWPLPSSFLKKVSPEGREREKEQSRNRVREEPKATSKTKERSRAERAQEQALRDQREREREAKYEEERRRYKEERRREKERRKEEEQRREERRHEQKVGDDYAHRTTRDQERPLETRDGLATGILLGKDPRLTRVKDSDDSDNSLMKPPRSIRSKRHHHRDHTSMMVEVPIVLRQPAFPTTPAQAPSSQPENNPASNLNESRRAMQSSHATPGASNDRSGVKPQKGSPSQNLTIPYPPGYAVSASDSEHALRREHRSKAVESGRSIERPRTSGAHRASLAHESVSKPPATQYVQPPLDKTPHKSEQKQSKGGWPFHRETPNSLAASQYATQTPARAVAPSLMRNDTPDVIPQVVSLKAGEGPADFLQETGTRRPAPPTAPSFVKDEVAHQHLPTVQVLQQSQTYDKLPRGVPRIAASVQLDPPGQVSISRAASPQPWLPSTQWPTGPQPMATATRLTVVPSPVVFQAPSASSAAPVDIQRPVAPPNSGQHGSSSRVESHPPTPEISWNNPTANSRSPAPPTHSHTVPLPPTTSAQRASPQGPSPVIHDVVGSKHARHASAPAGYASTQPSQVVPPPPRHIAPDLASVFPIREENADAYRQHNSQGERTQDTHPPRDTSDQWDRHGYTHDSARRMIVSMVPSTERTPRSAKTSPSQYPRVVNQGTPPKPPIQTIPAQTTLPPQSSTNLEVLPVHDPSRPAMYNTLHQNSSSTPYPPTSVYPSPSPRPHVEASPAINSLSVANPPTNNPSPKIKPGHSSPRSRSQAVAVAPSQGQTPPLAAHITTRTPSHDTGSTTLLGQTPSSQGSLSLQSPISPAAHPQQPIVPRTATQGGQQTVNAPAPVSDSLGDRNGPSHSSVPPRQTTSRHHHSMSAPAASVYAPTQPPPVRSQTQPTPKVLSPLSPMPVRYSTAQAPGDFHAARIPASAYASTLAPNPRQQRDMIPSPSQASEMNTPSSLAVSTKLPIVSDEPLVPVMSTQSLQEPKKKGGFFQGLGLFRSKSSAQKRHPHESKIPDDHPQAAISTRLASSKSPAPMHYESDSKVGTRPSKLKKSKPTAAPPYPYSAAAVASPQPLPKPVAISMPMSTAAIEEKFGPAPNPFASIRVLAKRYRTISGVSAEAVDGTNAGASTVLTSPANSTRSPTPKLIPPQRDAQQATHAWRNKEEAEARQRGNTRRPRPGVHFESYEDHPQAEHHRVNYAIRVREKARN